MPKINYSFSAMPTEWLFNKRLSAQEKVLIGVLIAMSGEQGKTRAGYNAISELAGISKRHCINLINNLINKKYLTRNIRNNRHDSSEIAVCLDNLGGEYPSAQECTRFHTKKDNRECNLKQSGVKFKAIGSEIECTLNKDLNKYLNIYTPDTQKTSEKNNQNQNKLATDDVAPVRTMPNEESASGVCGEFQYDICDKVLFDSVAEVLDKDLQYIQLFKVGSMYGVRPACRVYKEKAKNIFPKIEKAVSKSGIVIQYAEKNYQNEIIINFEEVA